MRIAGQVERDGAGLCGFCTKGGIDGCEEVVRSVERLGRCLWGRRLDGREMHRPRGEGEDGVERVAGGLRRVGSRSPSSLRADDQDDSKNQGVAGLENGRVDGKGREYSGGEVGHLGTVGRGGQRCRSGLQPLHICWA